jgi:DnaJ-domain-containing protein 1
MLEDYMTHAADALTIDPIQKLQKKVQDMFATRRSGYDRLVYEYDGR